jgi:hypothetical protein
MTRLRISIPVPFRRLAHTHPSVCYPIPGLLQPQAVLASPVFSLLCMWSMASRTPILVPLSVHSPVWIHYNPPKST